MLESLGQVYMPPQGSGGWCQNREPGVQAHASDTFNRVPGSLLLYDEFSSGSGSLYLVPEYSYPPLPLK